MFSEHDTTVQAYGSGYYMFCEHNKVHSYNHTDEKFRYSLNDSVLMNTKCNVEYYS